MLTKQLVQEASLRLVSLQLPGTILLGELVQGAPVHLLRLPAEGQAHLRTLPWIHLLQAADVGLGTGSRQDRAAFRALLVLGLREVLAKEPNRRGPIRDVR